MRTSQKVIVTLTLAFVITFAFAIVAYTGLFQFLESDFFRERVKKDQLNRLLQISERIEGWNSDLISRIEDISLDRSFQSVYSISQGQDNIATRANIVGALEDRLIGFSGIRVIENDGKIQYSSYAADIRNQQSGESGRLLYRNWSEVEGTFSFPEANSESQSTVIYDGIRQQIVFLIPAKDRVFTIRGWLLVFMKTSGIAEYLSSSGLTSQGSWLYVVNLRGLIVNIRDKQAEQVLDKIDEFWSVSGKSEEFALLAEGTSGLYWLASEFSKDNMWVGKLIPGRLLAYPLSMRILILLIFYTTISLLIFFFLNIRQDRIEILKQRIRKLQVGIAGNLISDVDGGKLDANDFESRREESAGNSRAV